MNVHMYAILKLLSMRERICNDIYSTKSPFEARLLALNAQHLRRKPVLTSGIVNVRASFLHCKTPCGLDALTIGRASELSNVLLLVVSKKAVLSKRCQILYINS